jgi:general secretion pathway protein A
MVGQPELKAMLSRPDMLQLSQRITARYHIGPLSKGEVGAYVNHRLAVAGTTRKIFPDSTIDKLYRLSKGIPRMINVICDRALLGAYVQGNVVVDNGTLVTAAREVLDNASWMKQPAIQVRWLLAGILLIGFITAVWVLLYNHKTPIRASVTIAGNEAASGNERLDALRRPEGQTAEQSLNMSFKALLRQWDVSYQPAKDVNACQQAEAKGLWCLKGRGNLNELLGLNKPAVLRFFDEKGREYYGTLTAVDEKTATVIVADETRRVGANEIRKRWYGDYTLFWKHPRGYTNPVRPGYGGPEVEWIDRHLSLLDGRRPQAVNGLRYDGELVTRMKRFQIAEGLVPDGIVGPQTLIHLGNATSENGPVLMNKREGR